MRQRLLAHKTWHAVDAAVTPAQKFNQTVTVRDTTPPTISGQGSDATIECPPHEHPPPRQLLMRAATSTVVEDSDTTAAGTCANDYSRTKTWLAVDACGNPAHKFNQTITVRDTTAPTISGQAAMPTIECPPHRALQAHWVLPQAVIRMPRLGARE